jgi:glucose/mannose-6-phosphate isomerase
MVDRTSLDDPAALAAADPGGMLEAAARLGPQLRAGFDIGSQAHPGDLGDCTTVVVCGMGGSGIAGDVARSLLGARLPFPIIASKGDALPAFCGPHTLVFAVSYSGATRETLACHQVAIERGCRVVTVGAGGALEQQARRAGGTHLRVPDDVPVPRAALGYLTGALLGWLDGEAGLDLRGPIAEAARFVESLETTYAAGQPSEQNEAKALAAWLLGRTPVIWGSEGLMEAAALRLKNQVNENAKLPAFSSVLPELAHNEIEGWGPGLGEGFGVVALRHDGEAPRVAERFDATVALAADAGLGVRQVRVAGAGPFERLFGSILLGDFASTYLALLRGVDPMPIPILTGLKARLRR